MKSLSTLILALLLTPLSTYAWSAPGHQAIAEAALTMLKGTPTEAKVNAILNGEDPLDSAIWLDRIRENFQFPDLANKNEAAAFKKAFYNSSDWHFCNFIVGSTEYSFDSKYAAPDDVVHSLETAIAVLEGAPSSMTKRQALRTVIHLVGDIHQPLHCITGFFDITDMSDPILLKDVSNPAMATQDRGGNQLMYTKTENLHHFWDLVLPNAIGSHVDDLASKLTFDSFDSQGSTPGDFHHWPEIWASASMQRANAAYDNITFKSAAWVDNPQHAGKKKLEIQIDLPGNEAGYKTNQEKAVKDQLSLAALHLAQLLSKIDFK